VAFIGGISGDLQEVRADHCGLVPLSALARFRRRNTLLLRPQRNLRRVVAPSSGSTTRSDGPLTVSGGPRYSSGVLVKWCSVGVLPLSVCSSDAGTKAACWNHAFRWRLRATPAAPGGPVITGRAILQLHSGNVATGRHAEVWMC
jgi:hypothetical protein